MILLVGTVTANNELFYNQTVLNQNDGKLTFVDGSYLLFDGQQVVEFHREVDRRLNNVIDQKTAKKQAFRLLEFVPQAQMKEFVFDERVNYYNNTYMFRWFGYVNETYVLDEGVSIDIRVDGTLMRWKFDNVKNRNFSGNLTVKEAIKIAEDHSLNKTKMELDHNFFLDEFEAGYNESLSWVIMLVGEEGQKYAVVNKAAKDVVYLDDLRVPSNLRKLEQRFFWIRIFFDIILLYVMYKLFFRQ